MNKNKKCIVRTAALCILVCLFVSMAACVPQGGEETTPPSEESKITYTVTVTNESGAPLTGLGIYIYEDSSMQELVWFAKTDEAGAVSFTDVPRDSYVAVFAEAPAGYEVDAIYPITGENTGIVLASGMVSGDDLANISYELGDTMLDFTAIAPDGTEYTLSQLLAEKKAVVLNFWYVGCQPCRNEFPYLQSAYEEYGEDIAVLAMDPVDTDSESITALRDELELTFPMMQCDPNWAKAMGLSAYPTTVVIDRSGIISLIHTGSITEELVFESIFAYYASDEYASSVVQSVEDIPMLPKPGSNADDPIELGGVTSFEVTVEPGQLMYYNIYKVNGMYLQIKNENAYAIYNGTTYYPNYGTVSFYVKVPDTYTPASVAFGNSGKETVTYTVTLAAPRGTFNNPYTLELEEFTTNVSAGNDQGVYYSFKATEAGTLTLQCLDVTAGVKYDYILYNLNTYAMRTMDEDGSYKEGSVSIKVNAGDTVKVTIGTLPDSSKSYPAATFTSLASFSNGTDDEDEEKVELVTYAITVTDENRTPVENVYLYVDVEGKATPIKTNEKGIASISLERGAYPVSLAVPGGYTANTTQFQLTQERDYFSIKLDTLIVETATYTVRAVNEDGAPVPNVLVTIGSSFGYTDATGAASFLLEKGSYTAVIGAPGGYICETPNVAFADGETELTVVLKAGSEDTAGKIAYSVKVVDYFGVPKNGVTVQFLSSGTPVAVQAVNSSGVASANLAPGTYTVALAFSGETMYYDQQKAVVTEDAAEITLTVVPGVSGEAKTLYVGDAYYVSVGGTYVKLQSNLVNYFMFEPVQSGRYRISTSDPAAKLSYWGGSTAFISEQPEMTDSNNTITLNIKEGNLGGTQVIGITGASECVLEIVRIGDAILDDSDIVAEIWEGEQTPTSVCKVTGASGKTLTYVDVAGQTGDYKLVYSEADGYYHLNSAGGPVVYVNLGPNAPYVSMYQMLGYTGFGGTSLTQSFYDDAGNVVRREDYTACMCAYVECIDESYGLYPLNDDLIYMMQQGGDYKGWWDSSNGNYLFGEVTGLNTEIAWMFAVCYFQ